MFQQACSTIQESVYGIQCITRQPNGIAVSTGTAFMIAPGIIVSASHLLHLENNISRPRHTRFQVIRAPDIGLSLEQAEIIEEDRVRDIALLRIENPRSNNSVTLATNIIQLGTSCGSLGFPLGFVDQSGFFNLLLRFQGAHISAFNTESHPSGRSISYYETDSLMYKGSSGCPGFLSNGNVFGMHNRSRVESSGSGRQLQTERFAISLWVPSRDIISFARTNEVTI